MANTLTDLYPVIYKALNIVSREQTGTIMASARNTSADEVAIGQPLRIPTAPSATARDITPGNVSPNDGDQVVGYTDILITKSKAAPIKWNGDEQMVGQHDSIVTDQFAEAMRVITNEVEADLYAAAVAGAGSTIGVDGTNPFVAAEGLKGFAAVQKALRDAGAPKDPRCLVLSSDHLTTVQGEQTALYRANEAGTDAMLREGALSRVQGLNIYDTSLAQGEDSIAFHSNALQLVARAPKLPFGGDGASDTMMIQDPKSGLFFQINMYRQYRQVLIEVGLAWGVKVIKPEHIVVLEG